MTQASLSLEQLAALLSGSRFHQLLGLELTEVGVTENSVVIRMPLSPAVERAPGTGQFHGGPIASLIDTTGDFALVHLLGFGVPTITLNVEYLRPSTGPWLSAKAVVRRAGRTVGFVDVEVRDPEGRVTALGRGCYGTKNG